MSFCRLTRRVPLVCLLALPDVAVVSAQAARSAKGKGAVFADDQVGNFPKRLAFKSGNMEVAAVKAALVKDYGIAAARLGSKGLGSTAPIEPNATPEGRQNNRRVELVKM